MRVPACIRLVVMCGATGLLAACGNDDNAELRAWMDETRRQAPVSVPEIPAPKTFTPYSYSGDDELDPYSVAKLDAALAKLQTAQKGGVRPDTERRKEPLESFPLDSITMVGTLERPGLTYALLRVDGSVFQVKVGNHVGQNFGRVTRITESDVELLEIIKDPAGEWTERTNRLELQEN